MASGTADLQRDLGGAIMQSILGALLTAGYAAAVGAADRRVAGRRRDHRQRPVPAAEVVRQRRGRRRAVPAVRQPDHRGGKTSFLDGADWAYTAGIIAILLGATLVFLLFPKRDDEARLLAQYQEEDAALAAARVPNRVEAMGLEPTTPCLQSSFDVARRVPNGAVVDRAMVGRAVPLSQVSRDSRLPSSALVCSLGTLCPSPFGRCRSQASGYVRGYVVPITRPSPCRR